MTDLTDGPVLRRITQFAVPLTLASIFQNLYLLVDSVVVGRFLGVTALAAVGVAGPIIYLLNAMFIGLSTAFTIRVARLVGGRKDAERRGVVAALATTTLVWTVGCMVVTFLLSGFVLSLMGITGDLAADTDLYLRWLALGFPGLFGSAAVSAYLRGLGDSSAAMWIQLVGNVVNAVLVWWFVAVLGLGLEGAAISTAIGATVALAAGVVVTRRSHPLPAGRVTRGPVLAELRAATRLGLPLAYQHIVLALGIMILVVIVEAYGETAIAAFTVIARIEGFAAIPFLALSGATTAFAAQNLGKHDEARARRGLLATLQLTTLLAVPLSVLLVVFRGPIARLFVDDVAAQELTGTYILVIFPFLTLYALMVVLHGQLNGMGRTVAPLVCTIIAFVCVQLPFAAVMGRWFGLQAVMWAVVASWTVGLVCSVIVLREFMVDRAPAVPAQRSPRADEPQPQT